LYSSPLSLERTVSALTPWEEKDLCSVDPIFEERTARLMMALWNGLGMESGEVEKDSAA
jgi:hypothetical protein